LDLEQVDLAALIDVMAKLQGTVITASDDDETVLRKMLGLPPLKAHLSRSAKTEAGKAPGDASAVPGPPGPPGPPGAPPGPPPGPMMMGTAPPLAAAAGNGEGQ
jgi:hypothetical protein